MNEFSTALKTVTWNEIAQLTGDCSHVPAALENLRSPEQSTRESAYWKLENHIVVQGGLLGGAFYVVPFLVHICHTNLANQIETGTLESLELLTEICFGATDFEACVDFRHISTPLECFTPAKTGIRAPLLVAVRFALGRGLNTLLRFANSEDSETRKLALGIVAAFPEYAHALAVPLKALQKSAANEEVSGDISQTIRSLKSQWSSS
ncbi:MAG: hypothetical protein Aurels2KO_40550 [Aureliella sp.]